MGNHIRPLKNIRFHMLAEVYTCGNLGRPRLTLVFGIATGLVLTRSISEESVL